MKLLMLNYEFPPLGGGAGNATYYLLKGFAQRTDLSITLITSSSGQYRQENFSDNIKIHYLNINKQGNPHYQSLKDLIKFSLIARKFTKTLIEKEKFDLVHAFFGLPCGYLAEKLHLPYLVSLRGSDVPGYSRRFYWLEILFFRRWNVRIWRKAKKVVANSENLKQLAQITAPNQSIDVIPNGIDTNEFFPVAAKDSIFTVLSTSRLIERKGIICLLRGFIDFHQTSPKSRLLIVGDGPLKDQLASMIKNNNLQNSVQLLGNITHDKIQQYYQQADVFVLPSLNEGMSNSLLEAMASGLAIIATDTGGVRELLEQDALLIEKNSSSSVANAIAKLYSQPELLTKKKINSRRRAENYSWSKVAEKYYDLYCSIYNR